MQVRPLLPAPRRNGLRSIQKARPVGRAFFIPLRHSSFSPQNFANANFCGGPGRPKGGKYASCARLRRLILSHRRARSAAAPSPHKILLRKLSWGPRPPCGRLIDFAPFKKPGRLAGLFSYRFVIPSRPKSRRLRGGWPRNAPAGAVLLPTKFCCANFRGGPGRPAGGKYASCASLAAAYFKPPTRSLRCGSFSPQNFAAQTFVGNLSARSALASPAMEYRDYQRNRERNCRLHCFSSYRSFVFILSSSSFSCFSD